MNILTQESKTIVSAATVVGAFSILSRVAGFIRDRILAGTFGAGETLDAYYTAFLLPDAIFNLLVVGALSASFIPLFSNYIGRQPEWKKAWHLTNTVLNILAVFFLAISFLLFLFARPAAALIAPGFDASALDLTAGMMRVMFLASFLLALSVVFGSVLQSLKKFLIYSLSPILYNIGIILGALVLVPLFGSIGLAWGVVLGAFLHLSLQAFAVVHTGYRYRWVWHPDDKDTRTVGKLMLPRMLGVGVGMLNTFIMTVIATTLGTGSVTMYQFAYNIQFFPIGVVAVSFAVAAFPTFVDQVNARNEDGFVEAFSQTVRHTLFFLIPAAIVLLLVRAQIVRVIVGAGAFGWSETIQTADTLAFFTLSLFAQGLILILARAFFAYRDTATPLIAAIASALVTATSGLLFSREFGILGLAMAFTLGQVMQLAILWALLHQKIGSLNESSIILSLFRMSLAGLCCGIVVQLFKSWVVLFISLQTFMGVLLQGLVAGLAGLSVYGVIAYLLKSREMLAFLASMHRQFFRRFRVSEPVVKETHAI